MKLEKGMYVRTDMGDISKIKSIWENERVFFENKVDIDWFTSDSFGISYLKKCKASHNIIDLIEQQDLLFIDISPDDCGGIVVPRIAETLAELEIYKERINSGEYILKGVVTREQIQSNLYEVGN